jgi:DNA-binding transcriptional ArsR family regulator
MTASEPRVKTVATRPTRTPSLGEADSQQHRKAQRAAILLKQASDPTRLQILLMLLEGESHVGSLGEDLSMSQPAISHHLTLLRHGGLITPRRQGKSNYYVLTDAGRELATMVQSMIVGEAPR